MLAPRLRIPTSLIAAFSVFVSAMRRSASTNRSVKRRSFTRACRPLDEYIDPSAAPSSVPTDAPTIMSGLNPVACIAPIMPT